MNEAGPVARVAALAPLLYETIVRDALVEDFGLGGDLTSEATIPAGRHARAAIVARASGVVAGLDAALFAFRALDPAVAVGRATADGETVEPGTTLATLAGDARALLGAERTALNLLGHLSGIATQTARYVAAVAGTHCRIAETRKTLPGLRALQKYAVRAGGGRNHRFRLDDAILIKDNHIAIAGGVRAALAGARARAGHLVPIEIEVDTLEQLDEVLASGEAVGTILVDNFSAGDVRAAVARVAGRVTLEASGGITLETVGRYAATGVDVISVGALTQNVAGLDVGLDVAV